MNTIHPSTPAARRWQKLSLSLTAAGLAWAGQNAGAATTLLQEYYPLHVGDHYTLLAAGATNTTTVEAGVAKYPGSFTLVSTWTNSETPYTVSTYVGYSDDAALTYEVDNGTNLAIVWSPPVVTMAEAALATLGTPFSGTSSYTTTISEAGQSVTMVETQVLSGVVSSTGTVTVIAGTFQNCLASLETEVVTTSMTVMGFPVVNQSTNLTTIIYAPNVGPIKAIGEGGTNISELIAGVIGGVTIGGGAPPPGIEITSPADGATVTSNPLTVQGTASSSAGIASVHCRVGAGAWATAQGTENWSFQASLSKGMNVIEAYAADSAGHLSSTDSVSVVYNSAIPAPPSIQITSPASGTQVATNSVKVQGTAASSVGLASVHCQVDGGAWSKAQGTTNWTFQATLTAGTNLIAAYAADTAGTLSATDTVTIVYAPQVSAVLPQGTYSGLFYGTNGVTPANSGAFTLTVMPKGSYTGKLLLGSSALSLSGTFNAQGSSHQAISPSKGASVAVDLQLDLPSGQQLTGSVQTTNWTADLLGYPSKYDAKTNPAPAGNYTMVLPGSTNPATGPSGYSYGTAALAAGGQITLKLTLADGTTASQGSSLTDNGLWPFYASLYKGQGVLIGWVGLTNHALTGTDICWVKESGATGKFYPKGFELVTELSGSQYVAPAAGKPVLTWTAGVITLQGGNLSATLTNTFTINAKNQVQVTGGAKDKLTLTLSPSTGSFTGSFLPPGATKPVPINGLLVQSLEWGAGSFLGTSQSGSVSFGEP